MGAHIAEVHEDCGHNHCSVCDGGLFICTVCYGAEGSLTSDCPGIKLGWNLLARVYEGSVDYFEGEWTKESHQSWRH